MFTNYLLVIYETNMVDSPIDSWCVDIGSTAHVCNSLQMFHETSRLIDENLELKVSSGH